MIDEPHPVPGASSVLDPFAAGRLLDGYGLTSMGERLLPVGGSLTVQFDDLHRRVVTRAPR